MRTALLLVSAAGCGGEPPEPKGQDETGVEETGDPDVDDTAGPVVCGLLGDVVASGELDDGRAVPGRIYELSAPGSAVAGTSWLWTVAAGALDDPASETPGWTPDLDLAPHVDEAVAVHVEAAAPGCVPEEAKGSIAVGWPDGLRVVVVFNPAVERSEEVARAYADLHSIPDDLLCGAEASDPTTLPGSEFEAWLDVVMSCAESKGERVHYLVPVWGVPYKVSDRIADFGTGAVVTVSLDGLLAFGRNAAGYTDARWNPLYRDGDSMAGVYDPYVPFGEYLESTGRDLFLVTRVDGADADAALDLVDRAGEAADLAWSGKLSGIVYVDGRYGDSPPATDEFGSYESGEWNMWGTRTVFEALGTHEVVWDGNDAEFGTPPAPKWCPDALFYAGWYSYYNYNDAFAWAPGAIGGHLDSCSACTLRDGGTWSAEALERGITATFGAVGEPYVAGMPEYDQFFLYLTQGATYAEAAYESTRVGAWMMVFVGDPLYRPFVTGE